MGQSKNEILPDTQIGKMAAKSTQEKDEQRENLEALTFTNVIAISIDIHPINTE